ncbi:ammonium transporter AmtB-like domain-containing protein, partial [Ochromonadaceae sp. CCMP2298]
GMVREKNVLTTICQVFSITCLITFLWMAFGYSLAFAPVEPHKHDEANPVIGDASRFWLLGLTIDTVNEIAPTIPEAIFCMYELTFAIITPALITGSFADRMRYGPMLLFVALWHLLVFCPIAHSVWHPKGFLYQAGVLDFAGGSVVHVSSGTAGLVSCVVLGHRKGLGVQRFEPHNILLTVVGASMLWVGWFGFNGGSALGASNVAAFAVLTTQISAAVAALSWMLTEWYFRGLPSVLGMVSGAVAGLVAITPGAGFVDPTGAVFIGLLAGPVCYGGVQAKHALGYDDALDAFGVHGIGGALGGILVGFFATSAVNGPADGVFYTSSDEGWKQLGLQVYGIVVCAGWSGLISLLLLLGIDSVMGLRVTEAEEGE